MESKSREAFEQVMQSKGWDVKKGESGDYVYERVHLMWMSWQASRAALVVELPQRLSPGMSGSGYTLIPNDNGDAYHCDDILLKLRAAGITVKGEGDE